jgi:erythromycin esterase-like protein
MSAAADTAALVDACRRYALPLRGSAQDHDALIALVGDAKLVLIGEASHGTEEFYRERARLTRRLIEEHGFDAVAAEADWPDAYRVNRFVRDQGPDRNPGEALAGFARFPAWMWRNVEVLDFIAWLRGHNDRRPRDQARVGFYGLDLYSLYASIEAVIGYLDRVDPSAAQRARSRYACFDATREDGQAYGLSAGIDLSASCEKAVTAQLDEMRHRAFEFAGTSPLAEDELFFAEQNARVAKNAEAYYRAMFHRRVSSWNLRDQHMMDTLVALIAHLERAGGGAKIVVWAHNSHLGDARATEMGAAGEWNLGQLVRERYGARAALIGFSTYTGSVTAASSWGAPAEQKSVRPALPGSYEDVFHRTGLSRFALSLTAANQAVRGLSTERLERAIGVIYLPQSERVSHYFQACLPAQFDAIIHIDETRAVAPLERAAALPTPEAPETFPSAV